VLRSRRFRIHGKLKGFCMIGDSCAFRVVGGHSCSLVVEIALSFHMSIFHLVRGPVLSYPNLTYIASFSTTCTHATPYKPKRINMEPSGSLPTLWLTRRSTVYTAPVTKCLSRSKWWRVVFVLVICLLCSFSLFWRDGIR
jgi:hypothetical protein